MGFPKSGRPRNLAEVPSGTTEPRIAELCRREGIASSTVYYGWSKEFLEAGKRRLASDTARAATSEEVKVLRREGAALKEVVADLTRVGASPGGGAGVLYGCWSGHRRDPCRRQAREAGLDQQGSGGARLPGRPSTGVLPPRWSRHKGYKALLPDGRAAPFLKPVAALHVLAEAVRAKLGPGGHLGPVREDRGTPGREDPGRCDHGPDHPGDEPAGRVDLSNI